MTLSKRLSVIESLVQTGSRVCDVGTDHGYLPAFLYKSGKCKSVCATDIRKKPLENARKNLNEAGAQGVKLYLCDGLEKITRDMADTVIIAGMGGEVISGIIDRATFLKDETVTLILQPTTSADRLRDYLANNGFVVLCEKAVCDNGKVYAVMQANYCGISYPIDDLRRVIGLIRPHYDDAVVYINKQFSVIKKRADELKVTDKNSMLYKSDCMVLSEIKKMLKTGDSNGV